MTSLEPALTPIFSVYHTGLQNSFACHMH